MPIACHLGTVFPRLTLHPALLPFVALILAVLAIPGRAGADELKLAWDPATDGITTGYVIFVGTVPNSFTRQEKVGRKTTHTVTGLTPGVTYYFVVKAHDATGQLSGPSNQVAGTVSVAAPSYGGAGNCVTPDPFVALGGGTCVGGGWLPPGMAPPAVTPPKPAPKPAPAPAPPPAPTPAPAPGSGGCVTSDPFVALGGGTCISGGWLPPGLAPAAVAPPKPSPKPAPAPTPTSPPAHAPAPSGGCVTSDPFVALGGGTCINGGWLPPGMAPPSVAPTNPAPTPSSPAPAPVPSPTPAPGPAPVVGGCVTSDPFVALGGGTCINSGWLPPGMAPPAVAPTHPTPAAVPTDGVVLTGNDTCITSDPFVGLPGLVGVCRGGGWIPATSLTMTATMYPGPHPQVHQFVADDGLTFLLRAPEELPVVFQQDGLRVFVRALILPVVAGSDGVDGLAVVVELLP